MSVEVKSAQCFLISLLLFLMPSKSGGQSIAVGVLLPIRAGDGATAMNADIAISRAALELAASEISSSGTLLPGYSFSLDIKEVGDTKNLMDQAIALQQNNALFSYIGAYSSFYTEAVHSLFSYTLYPQVAFQSRSVVLDEDSGGYLIRLAPSDSEWIRAMVQVVNITGWRCCLHHLHLS